jgi:hypothetical protein
MSNKTLFIIAVVILVAVFYFFLPEIMKIVSDLNLSYFK